MDIAVDFTEGETFAIESLAYNRMTFLKAKRQTFATVKAGENRPTKACIPERLRTIEPLAKRDAVITRKIKLSVDPRIRDGKDFRLNDSTHKNDKPVVVGELQI